jgi:glycosyltransferase involved in cell wall biosynthesis
MSLLAGERNQKLHSHALDFFTHLPSGIELRGRGLIKHEYTPETGLASKCTRAIRQQARFVVTPVEAWRQRHRLRELSEGYLTFLLYGVTLSEDLNPNSVWSIEAFRKLIHRAVTYVVRRYPFGCLGRNRYAWSYNPVGIEMAYVLQVLGRRLGFEAGVARRPESWLNLQFQHYYDAGSALMERNAVDPSVLAARVYEATRLLDYPVTVSVGNTSREADVTVRRVPVQRQGALVGASDVHFGRPLVSVVIPVYNDAQGLRQTLECLIAQDCDSSSYEVIIVDNDSTDETLSVGVEFAHRYPGLVRTESERRVRSSYAARNRGIEIARGSLMAFLDADMSVSASWLTSLKDAFEDPGMEYLACNVEIYSNRNTLASRYNRLTGFPIAYYVDRVRYAPTCCLVVRRELFDRVGRFDARLISKGDVEFGNRIYSAGVKLAFRPDIVMFHPARHTVRQLVRKKFRIGRGARQCVRYYPDRYKKLRRPFLDVRTWLPGRPWKFREAMKGRRGWEDAALPDKVALYLVSWLTTLAERVGYNYEWLKEHRAGPRYSSSQ